MILDFTCCRFAVAVGLLDDRTSPVADLLLLWVAHAFVLDDSSWYTMNSGILPKLKRTYPKGCPYHI